MKARLILSITLVLAKRLRTSEEMPTKEEGSIVSNTEFTETKKHGGQKEKISFKTEEKTKLKEANGFGDAVTKHKEKACKCVGGAGCKCLEPNPVVTETQIDEDTNLSQEDVDEEESRRRHRHRRHNRHH